MSKLFGKADLNGPANKKSNFPKTPIQKKPDWGNDQTQNNLPFPSGIERFNKNILLRR